ncbi:MAG: hypothetical protein IT292_11550 [Deltaproteobacteria bacterium]|nr:hypothetical protein [Deltaproteobacteria bacterium]
MAANPEQKITVNTPQEKEEFAVLPKRTPTIKFPERSDRHHFTEEQLLKAKQRYSSIDWDTMLAREDKVVELDQNGRLRVNGILIMPPARDLRPPRQRNLEWTPEKSQLTHLKKGSIIPDGPAPERATGPLDFAWKCVKEYIGRPVYNMVASLGTLEGQLTAVSMLKYVGAGIASIMFAPVGWGVVATMAAVCAINFAAYSGANLISRTLETIHGAREKGANFVSALLRSAAIDSVDALIQAPFVGVGKLISTVLNKVPNFVVPLVTNSSLWKGTVGTIGKIFTSTGSALKTGAQGVWSVTKDWAISPPQWVHTLASLPRATGQLVTSPFRLIGNGIGKGINYVSSGFSIVDTVAKYSPRWIRNLPIFDGKLSLGRMYDSSKIVIGTASGGQFFQPAERIASATSLYLQNQALGLNQHYNPYAIPYLVKRVEQEFNSDIRYANLSPTEREKQLYIYKLQRGMTEEQLNYSTNRFNQTSFFTGLFSPIRFANVQRSMGLKAIGEANAIFLSYSMAEGAANDIDVFNTKLFRQIDPDTPQIVHNKANSLVIALSDSASRMSNGLLMSKQLNAAGKAKFYSQNATICDLLNEAGGADSRIVNTKDLQTLHQEHFVKFAKGVDELHPVANNKTRLLSHLSEALKLADPGSDLSTLGRNHWYNKIRVKEAQGKIEDSLFFMGEALGLIHPNKTDTELRPIILSALENHFSIARKTGWFTKGRSQNSRLTYYMDSLKTEFPALAGLDDLTIIHTLKTGLESITESTRITKGIADKTLDKRTALPEIPEFLTQYHATRFESGLTECFVNYSSALQILYPHVELGYSLIGPSYLQNIADSKGFFGTVKAISGLDRKMGSALSFTSKGRIKQFKEFLEANGLTEKDVIIRGKDGCFVSLGEEFNFSLVKNATDKFKALQSLMRRMRNDFIYDWAATDSVAERKTRFDNAKKVIKPLKELDKAQKALNSSLSSIAELDNDAQWHKQRVLYDQLIIADLHASPADAIKGLNKLARSFKYKSWDDFIKNPPTNDRLIKFLTKNKAAIPWLATPELGSENANILLGYLNKLHQDSTMFLKVRSGRQIDFLKHATLANDPKLNALFEKTFADILKSDFSHLSKEASSIDKMNAVLQRLNEFQTFGVSTLNEAATLAHQISETKNIKRLYRLFGWEKPLPSRHRYLAEQETYDKAFGNFADSLADDKGPLFGSSKPESKAHRETFSLDALHIKALEQIAEVAKQNGELVPYKNTLEQDADLIARIEIRQDQLEAAQKETIRTREISNRMPKY